MLTRSTLIDTYDLFTFNDSRPKGHDSPDEEPPCLSPLLGESAILRGRPEKLLADVEHDLAAGVRNAKRCVPAI